uniref:Uncharacterized protein n=1 Tax=Cacopsylla melanoneura TaxID=428564 RepID=A0A8D8QWQ7_9HEMI
MKIKCIYFSKCRNLIPISQPSSLPLNFSSSLPLSSPSFPFASKFDITVVLTLLSFFCCCIYSYIFEINLCLEYYDTKFIFENKIKLLKKNKKSLNKMKLLLAL